VGQRVGGCPEGLVEGVSDQGERRRPDGRAEQAPGQEGAQPHAGGAGQEGGDGISAFAGRQVEVSITSLSDWGLQQFPGVFIDDIVVSTGEGSTSFEDDGDPLDGWTVPGAPQDAEGIEGPNRNDWVRRGGLGIKEGSAVATADTVYMGFGFEGITGTSTRNQIVDRVIDYLLR
jgi:hypothetical protein